MIKPDLYDRLAAHGATPGAFRLLLHMTRHDVAQITVNQLRRAVGMSRRTVVSALEELADLGIVTVTDAGDVATLIESDDRSDVVTLTGGENPANARARARAGSVPISAEQSESRISESAPRARAHACTPPPSPTPPPPTPPPPTAEAPSEGLDLRAYDAAKKVLLEIGVTNPGRLLARYGVHQVTLAIEWLDTQDDIQRPAAYVVSLLKGEDPIPIPEIVRENPYDAVSRPWE